MLICCDCGKLLEEDDVSEFKAFDNAWGYEKFIAYKGCPYCGSGSLAETTLICDCCGEYIESDYVRTEDDRTYCNNCYSINNAVDEAQGI